MISSHRKPGAGIGEAGRRLAADGDVGMWTSVMYCPRGQTLRTHESRPKGAAPEAIRGAHVTTRRSPRTNPANWCLQRKRSGVSFGLGGERALLLKPSAYPPFFAYESPTNSYGRRRLFRSIGFPPPRDSAANRPHTWGSKATTPTKTRVGVLCLACNPPDWTRRHSLGEPVSAKAQSGPTPRRDAIL